MDNSNERLEAQYALATRLLAAPGHRAAPGAATERGMRFIIALAQAVVRTEEKEE